MDPRLVQPEARGRFAEEISEEAYRIAAKLERARQVMQEDAALVQRLRQELEQLRASERLLAERLAETEAQLEARASELSFAAQSQGEWTKRREEFEAAVSERDQTIAELRARISTMEDQYIEAASLAADNRKALASAQAELDGASAERSDLSSRLAIAEQQLAQERERVAVLEKQARDNREHIGLLETELEGFAERFAGAAEITQRAMDGLHASKALLSEQVPRLEVEAHNLRQRLQQAETRVERLEGQLDALRAENAGLRVEQDVQITQLEEARNDARAEVAVLQRRLREALPVKVVARGLADADASALPEGEKSGSRSA